MVEPKKQALAIYGMVSLLYPALRQRAQVRTASLFFDEVSERRSLGRKREDRPAAFAGRSFSN